MSDSNEGSTPLDNLPNTLIQGINSLELPNPDGSRVNTDSVLLYHARREQQLNGTESLHWTYLENVHTSEKIWCNTCGWFLAEDASVCPYCGNKNSDHFEMEG